MNSYKYSRQRSHAALGSQARRRLIIILVVLLMAAVIALSMLYVRAASYRSASRNLLARRLGSTLVDCIEQANRLSGGVRSSSAARLSQIRAHIHAMKLINEMSISLEGERGRLVPEEAITALFDDVDTYEKLIQTATAPTLEIRTRLLTHLATLESLLRAPPGT